MGRIDEVKMKRSLLPFMTLAVASMVGCSNQRFENVGQACITNDQVADTGSAGLDLDLAAGGEAVVTVTLSTCTSYSYRERRTRCKATLQGDRIEVDALSVGHLPNQQVDTCQAVIVRCDLPALDSGGYTLAYGGDVQTFEVPYQGSAVCAGM